MREFVYMGGGKWDWFDLAPEDEDHLFDWGEGKPRAHRTMTVGPFDLTIYTAWSDFEKKYDLRYWVAIHLLPDDAFIAEYGPLMFKLIFLRSWTDLVGLLAFLRDGEKER